MTLATWIPASAGMTLAPWIPASAGMTLAPWIPAYAGMTLATWIRASAGMTLFQYLYVSALYGPCLGTPMYSACSSLSSVSIAPTFFRCRRATFSSRCLGST